MRKQQTMMALGLRKVSYYLLPRIRSHFVKYLVGCKEDWIYFNHTDKCYKYFDNLVSWHQARILCQHKGSDEGSLGDLASAPDGKTNDFLSLLTKEG